MPPDLQLEPQASCLLRLVRQPRTVRQLAEQLEVERDTCSERLRSARRRGLVVCVNAESPRTRVYALTGEGHRRLAGADVIPLGEGRMDDWRDFAFVSSRHRSAVIKAMEGPMQAAAIKRRARYLDPGVRMSANNVRDVLRVLLRRRLVRVAWVRRRAHPHFELTALGCRLQHLLRRADSGPRS